MIQNAHSVLSGSDSLFTSVNGHTPELRLTHNPPYCYILAKQAGTNLTIGHAQIWVRDLADLDKDIAL